MDKMVAIMKIDLPDDVLRYTASFLFWDIRSIEYHHWQHHNKIMRRMLFEIIDTMHICKRFVQWRIAFCENCGDFNEYELDTRRHDNIICKCNHFTNTFDHQMLNEY